MTIPRTFVVEIIDEQDVTRHLRIKGTNDLQVMKDVEQEHPDDCIVVCRALQKYKREEKRYLSEPVFPINPFRGGRYIYRNKGKKKRGRKNYPIPNGGYASLIKVRFEYVESYSSPVADYLQRWMKLLVKPEPGKEYPVIEIDSLGFLDEFEPARKMTIDLPNIFRGVPRKWQADFRLPDKTPESEEADRLLAGASQCDKNGDFTGMLLHMQARDAILKTNLVEETLLKQPSHSDIRRLTGER